VASFLLESYTAHREPAGLDELIARARTGAEAATLEGIEVRHVRSFLAPDDDICFHVFEAPSAEAVIRVSELANFDNERITEVIE
jgi:Protein of unknown function (DUF4242)